MKIEELVKDRWKYLNVPNLKLAEARFFLEKMQKKQDEINAFVKPADQETKRVRGDEFPQVALEISFYASAFFSAILSALDTTAIFFTKERESRFWEINFENWLCYQKSHCKVDEFIETLNQEYAEWINELRRTRHTFVHHGHPYIAIKRFYYFSFGKEKPFEYKFMIADLEEEKEIVPYCEH